MIAILPTTGILTQQIHLMGTFLVNDNGTTHNPNRMILLTFAPNPGLKWVQLHLLITIL